MGTQSDSSRNSVVSRRGLLLHLSSQEYAGESK